MHKFEIGTKVTSAYNDWFVYTVVEQDSESTVTLRSVGVRDDLDETVTNEMIGFINSHQLFPAISVGQLTEYTGTIRTDKE